MLTNYDLEDLASTLKLNLVGVYSKDELPNERKIGSYIINLQDHDKGNGSHWTFAKIFPNGKAIYFDSYGFNCPPDVEYFLRPFKPFAYSNRQIQAYKSDMCGYYCIACDLFFTYDANKKKSVDENYQSFLSMWSNIPEKNASILKEYLSK
jgi:hypothetical protein